MKDKKRIVPEQPDSARRRPCRPSRALMRTCVPELAEHLSRLKHAASIVSALSWRLFVSSCLLPLAFLLLHSTIQPFLLLPTSSLSCASCALLALFIHKFSIPKCNLVRVRTCSCRAHRIT